MHVSTVWCASVPCVRAPPATGCAGGGGAAVTAALLAAAAAGGGGAAAGSSDTIGCWRRRQSPAAAAAAAVALAGAGHGGAGNGDDGHGGDGHGGDGEGDSAGEGEAGGTAAPQPTACFWPRWMGCCSLWQRHRFSSAGRKFCLPRTDGQRLIGGVMHVRCTYSRPLKRSSEPPAPDRTWSVRSAGG